MAENSKDNGDKSYKNKNGKKIIVHTENLFFSYKNSENNNIDNNADAKDIDRYALKNINLDIQEGSFTVILGHNGSGKSTLAKLFNMILPPTKGKVYIDGVDASKEENLLFIRQNVGMVFQNPDNQLVATIVEEDVAFGPENLGTEPSEIRRLVDESLDIVGMTKYKLHSPHRLSGGQKQRIAIAGVIAMMPKLMIFDEATAMLDPEGRREVLDTVRRLNSEKKMTILLITHYMNEAVLADRVIVLNKGEVYLDGTPAQVFSQIEKIKEAGLDAPQVTELMNMLENEKRNTPFLKRYVFPHDILHTEDAADLIEIYAGKDK